MGEQWDSWWVFWMMIPNDAVIFFYDWCVCFFGDGHEPQDFTLAIRNFEGNMSSGSVSSFLTGKSDWSKEAF